MANGRSARSQTIYEAENELKHILDRALHDDVREYRAYGSVFDIPLELRFTSAESVQRYLDQVIAMSWMPSTSPVKAKAAPKRDGKYRGYSKYVRESGTILLPDHGGGLSGEMREEVILHELAHHLAEKDGHEEGSGFIPSLRMLFLNRFGGSIQSLFDIILMERGVNPHE